jgi:hypothetical protein
MRIFGPKRNEVSGGGENCLMTILIICTPRQNFSVDQIEKNDMRGACSRYGGEEK